MTGRRALLGVTVSAVAARTVLPAAAQAEPVHPDAELLEACAAFDVLERQFQAVRGHHAPGSPEEDAA